MEKSTVIIHMILKISNLQKTLQISSQTPKKKKKGEHSEAAGVIHNNTQMLKFHRF